MSTASQVFEVIGVYFANCFWNNLYREAEAVFTEERKESLEEAYHAVLHRYIMAFCRRVAPGERVNKNYLNITEDLSRYYQSCMQLTLTHHEFISRVVEVLLPPQEFKSLSEYDSRKDQVFREIMSKTLTAFARFLSEGEVSRVCSQELRRNAEEARGVLLGWKRKFSELLAQEKNNFCSLLLARNTGLDPHTARSPALPQVLIDRYNLMIKKLIEEKSSLIKERNQYANLAREYKLLLAKLPETPKVSPPQATPFQATPPRAPPPQAPPLQEFEEEVEFPVPEYDREEIPEPENPVVEPKEEASWETSEGEFLLDDAPEFVEDD